MPHADIIEAIAVIKASTSFKMHPRGAAMITLLDQYAKGTVIGKDIIQYDPRLGPTDYGQSYSDWLSTRINISPSQKGDIATTAFIISHEVLHRVLNDADSIPGELQCRAHDATFGLELKTGIAYVSPSGSPMRASLMGSTLLAEVDKTILAASRNKLIDRILSVKRYQGILTPGWLVANYRTHEGGLRNREPETLGHFARALAAERSGDYGPQIVDILDAITVTGWPAAKAAISPTGDLSALKKALRMVYVAPIAGTTISKIEARLGINLKV